MNSRAGRHPFVQPRGSNHHLHLDQVRPCESLVKQVRQLLTPDAGASSTTQSRDDGAFASQFEGQSADEQEHCMAMLTGLKR